MKTMAALSILCLSMGLCGCCQNGNPITTPRVVAARFPQDVVADIAVPAEGSASDWYGVQVVAEPDGVRVDIGALDVDGTLRTFTVILPANRHEWTRLVEAVEALARVEHVRSNIYNRPDELNAGPMFELSYVMDDRHIVRRVPYLEAATDWVSRAIVEETLVAANVELARAVVAATVAGQHTGKNSWASAHQQYERAVESFLRWGRQRLDRMHFGLYVKRDAVLPVKVKAFSIVDREEEHRTCAQHLQQRWQQYLTYDIDVHCNGLVVIVSLRDTIRCDAWLPLQVPKATIERLLHYEF